MASISPDSPAAASTSRLLMTVLLPFGLGYYLSYLYRTVNNVIARPLAADLGLSAADLGLLTSVYFIVFAAFQTPLGIILDRFGPRRIQAALLPLAAAGGALFAVADDFYLLAIARGLIGLGVSGCLMAAIQANVLWFPRARLPLVNAVIAAFGSFGALSATVPVELAFAEYGWRSIFAALAVLTVAAAFLVFAVVPDRRAEGNAGEAALAAQLRGLRRVYTDAYFWRVGAVAFMHNAVFLSYQALWMGPWLRDVAGLGLPDMARSLMWFNVGMFTGVLSIGVIAERAQRVGIRPVHMFGGGLALSVTVQMLFALEQTALATPLCFAFGFFGSAGLLVYSVFGQHFPREIAGRVNTAQNMLSFICAFAGQWGVGVIIARWPELPGGNYHPDAHQAALLTMICFELAAFALFLWPRRGET